MTDPIRAAVAEAVHVPLLIVLGGLPATGKTVIARGVARDLTAVHLRVDTIEEALRKAGVTDVVDHGYRVAYALAVDNLRLGHWVIADAVNPLALTRDAWRTVGEAGDARVVEIEVVCSDARLHERRVAERAPDIAGQVLPTWREVLDRHYEPWEPAPALRIDTATGDAADWVRQALTAIVSARRV